MQEIIDHINLGKPVILRSNLKQFYVGEILDGFKALNPRWLF